MASASAQEQTKVSANADLAVYEVKREVTLFGKVLAFTATAEVAPLGAHVMLQTSAGVVDVHLGDSRLLAANHFTIRSGDSLRIIGEPVAYAKGSQFVARIVQNGTQVLSVRSIRGIPLTYMAPRNGAHANSPGGAR